MWHWICKTISIWYYLKSYSLGSSRCLLVVRKEKYDSYSSDFYRITCVWLHLHCVWFRNKGKAKMSRKLILISHGKFCEELKKVQKWLWWNGNSFFDKFYKVQNFFPYAIPIVLDNEPPRMWRSSAGANS